MRHVSSRSGVATLQTAIHLLLTYSLNRKCLYTQRAAIVNEGTNASVRTSLATAGHVTDC